MRKITDELRLLNMMSAMLELIPKITETSKELKDSKKAIAFTPLMLWVFIIGGALLLGKPLFTASKTTTALLGNPIIVLLIIIGFFLYATRGK